ncbi:linker nucleoporin NIC96 [Aspergillus saccharolyticus JOP 1030-1]|uniref:NIC-domain-containing protein n=1 Tax=Aspergillus saccharolyticus JOP 1030-1 TaxID=1450539 RepID=A0A318ZK89_9EURO|nr:NIC-domain-containing protein [Aspergillus saccharolyticus JOP 1030-1]PYH47267.1 NIC-domain-containing protein [Aspergillus saccharolyticus JOP 1030-1]
MTSTNPGSLFALGGTAAATQPARLFQNNTSSTLGNTSTTQTPLGGSLLATQLQAQQQPIQSSSFGQNSMQPSAAQPAHVSSQTQPAYFNSLLERGKKRPLSATGLNSTFDSLPTLQLGLDDIRKKARELGTKESKIQQKYAAHSKAHYMLAASGVSPGHALRDLKALDPQVSLSVATKEQESFDPDNQKYLRNLQQRGRQVMIAESLARTQRDFDLFLEERLDLDWEEQRRKIFQHFGLTHKDDNAKQGKSVFGRSVNRTQQFDAASARGPASASRRSVFGRSGLEKSVIGLPETGAAGLQILDDSTERTDGPGSHPSDSRFLREKMGYYSDKVQLLNLARLQSRTFPVLHEFSEVEGHAGGDVPRQLYDAYRALINIVGEAPEATNVSDPSALRERQFSSDYLDETPTSRKATNLRNRIVEGSRTFLEKQFYTELESKIAKNPREAQLGGIPTVINKVRAYVRLRAARRDLAPDGTELQMVGEDYCWILIFYLLRCGFVMEAAEYVSQDPGFRSLDHKFVTYMTTYAQTRRLPRELQQKINGEYQQRSRNAPDNTVDPYRMACYKIIGRCELSCKHLDGINQSVDDWTWLQFTLAREDDRAEEVAGDVFGLEDIQSDIAGIGQTIFGKSQDSPGGYGTFFLLQILGGMFEHAITYLATYAPVSAVHFAIALAYYGLLRVSDFYTSGEGLLSFTVKQYSQVNFASLITQYTKQFRTANVEAAIDYFSLLCLNADLPGSLGKSQAAVCHEALREYILETRDFAKLLGDVRCDGSRIKGLIEQRISLIKLVDQEEFLKTITVQAAAIADDKGLITDAVLLYHLAEDYDRVIDIINRALSDAVAVDLGGPVLKLQPLRPRADLRSDNHGPRQGALLEPGSSLSLTAVEDPVILAKNMIGLYNANALYYQQIRQVNRDSCGLLLRMMEAKAEVEAGRWTPALDAINDLNLLPLRARGSVSFIRGAAQAFSSFPAIISHNIGHVIMWSITCIGHERDRLGSSVYENEIRQGLAGELLVMAKDLMVFSGMVKYKLPPKVYETLARAGAEIGAY